MAQAFKMSVLAGRSAYEISNNRNIISASASSPMDIFS